MDLTVHVSYWRMEHDRWHCWSYPSDNGKFEEWMKRTCPKASISPKYNSGNPMYITCITDEKEAMLFQLAWNCK